MNKDPAGPYDIWLTGLSGTARSGLGGPCAAAQPAPPRPDDQKDEYGLWRRDLSEPARDHLDTLVPLDAVRPEEAVSVTAYRYAAVECENGEFPVVRLLRTADALARYLGRLEGQDVSVIPFYGQLLNFSAGPVRYLQLPDLTTLLVIPRQGEGPCQRIDADLVQFEAQEDGFLGPPELANTTTLTVQLSAMQEQPGSDEDEGDAAGAPVDVD